MLEQYQMLFESFPWAWPCLAGLLGLLVGSFINVVAYRFPLMLEQSWIADARYITNIITAGHSLIKPRPLEFEQSIPLAEPAKITLSKPRSHCPQCKTQVKAWQNIPLISFILLKGKCGHPECDASIPKRYFVVELLTGLSSYMVAQHFGFTALAMAALVLTWVLMSLTLIDLDTQLLPDQIVIPLVWIGVLVNLDSLFVPLKSSVTGAVAGYMSLWSLFHLFRILTGKEGMGFGDFKLFAALGAWLGASALPAIITLASLFGSVLGLGMIVLGGHNSQKPIAFGPYLAVAGWIYMIWSEQINHYFPIAEFAHLL